MPRPNVFQEIENLRREMDRMASELFPFQARRQGTFLPGRAARQYPLVNMYDDEKFIYLEALAPGLNTQNLDVTVVHNTVTISGEKLHTAPDAKPEQYHRSERAAGRFVRSIELPTEVNDTKVTADYKNGILLITLPKAEKAIPRRISVKVG
ncbi:MAG TPA: Hsp20/alpha crystallin family protein [bacterium]|nr:Hsp20/alpha crystallin family protein [bacterium]HQL61153.1 Hsp20/alpha crystallin family protein [bacterium]